MADIGYSYPPFGIWKNDNYIYITAVISSFEKLKKSSYINYWPHSAHLLFFALFAFDRSHLSSPNPI
jgi:hypothetical protein